MKKIPSIVLAAAMTLGMSGHFAAAQTYPDRPVRLVVPFAAGGAGDTLARIIGQSVEADLGQRVLIENRTGANGAIGTQSAAKAASDGYTILQVSTVNVINAQLQDVPFSFDRDFMPIVGVGSFPILLAVSADSGIRTIADLVAYAKSTNGGITYATGGVGSVAHVTTVRFLNELKIAGTHVPYSGNNLGVQALMGNHVQLFFPQTVDVLSFVNSPQIRLLGVIADRRLPSLPNVPTFEELGIKNFNASVWYGYLAPANTPANIVERLNKAFTKAMSDPAVQDRLNTLSYRTDVADKSKFAGFMQEEAARWKKVIVENNIKPLN